MEFVEKNRLCEQNKKLKINIVYVYCLQHLTDYDFFEIRTTFEYGLTNIY